MFLNKKMRFYKIEETIIKLITDAFQKAANCDLLPAVSLPSIELQIPRDKGHGDLASNIAMKVSSQVRRPPAETAKVIASLIEPELNQDTDIIGIEADLRRGFINFTINPSTFHNALREILRSHNHCGESKAGEGSKVLLEFISANPTGPLTVAHGRQAAVGDVLAELMKKAGFRVDREYYLNDRGRQMNILGASVYLRWRQLRGEELDLPAEYYQGEYIINMARGIQEDQPVSEERTFSDLSETEAIDYCSAYASGILLGMIKEELRDFGVTMDGWVSEMELVAAGEVEKVLGELAGLGSTYEKEGALWFRSSAYGDEKDRVLRKSGGDLTYLSSDIAYHREKYGRGYNNVIDFWGPDHHGYDLPPEYFSRIEANSFHGMPWFQFNGESIVADDCINSRPPLAASQVVSPVLTFAARNAPMGVAFIPSKSLGENLQYDAVVALHGSWATQPDGNFFGSDASRRHPKIVVVRFDNGKALSIEDLVRGFQLQNGKRWARPIGVAVGPDGALYFTSDGGLIEGLFRLKRVKIVPLDK